MSRKYHFTLVVLIAQNFTNNLGNYPNHNPTVCVTVVFALEGIPVSRQFGLTAEGEKSIFCSSPKLLDKNWPKQFLSIQLPLRWIWLRRCCAVGAKSECEGEGGKFYRWQFRVEFPLEVVFPLAPLLHTFSRSEGMTGCLLCCSSDSFTIFFSLLLAPVIAGVFEGRYVLGE